MSAAGDWLLLSHGLLQLQRMLLTQESGAADLTHGGIWSGWHCHDVSSRHAYLVEHCQYHGLHQRWMRGYVQR